MSADSREALFGEVMNTARDTIESLRAELAEMREAFHHHHVASGDGTDTCKACGLDLRNRVHAALTGKPTD